MLLKKILLSIVCMHAMAYGMEEMKDVALQKAIRDHDIYKLGVLCGQYKDIMDSRYAPLALAADAGKWDIVELLLKQGANPNNTKPANLPLHRACELRSMIGVDLLLKYHADVNIHDDVLKETPLHHLINSNVSIKFSDEQASIATTLLSHGADPNFKDHRGETPFYKLIWYILYYRLFVAQPNEVKQKRLAKELIRIFLSYGADMNIDNKEGKSPLEIATISDKELASYMTTLYKKMQKNRSISITLQNTKAQDVIEQLTQLIPSIHTVVSEKRTLKLIGEEKTVERIAQEIREWDLECRETKEHCDQEIGTIVSEMREKMRQKQSFEVSNKDGK